MPQAPLIELPVNEQLQNDFAQLLEKSFTKEITVSSLVVGEIVRIDRDSLLVDIGGKYEGVVPMKEINECDNAEQLRSQFSVNQVREFFVLKDLEDEFQYILSVRRVESVKNWERLAELKEASELLEATIIGPTKGGMLATVMGLKGFIPASQLRVTRALDELAGETLPVKVLEVDRSRNKLILSHRQAVFEMKAAQRSETLASLREEQIVTGEIVKVTDFGVFVDINGIDGLLPLSEITWQRIKHPSDVLVLGQEVTVQVLNIDLDRQRISLSLKRLEADPWDDVEHLMSVGSTMTGKLSKPLANGILVELLPGVEAYCPYDDRGERLFHQVEEGRFEVMSMAIADRRITLSYLGSTDEA